MNPPFSIDDLSITPAILEASGYKEFSDPLKRDSAAYLKSYQKRFDNKHGKAYFLNFNFYDRTAYFIHQGPLQFTPYAWEADMQNHAFGEAMAVNTQIFSSNQPLEAVEAFCKRMFEQMLFMNYEYWNANGEAEHHAELLAGSEKAEIDKCANAPSPKAERPRKPI